MLITAGEVTSNWRVAKKPGHTFFARQTWFSSCFNIIHGINLTELIYASNNKKIVKKINLNQLKRK